MTIAGLGCSPWRIGIPITGRPDRSMIGVGERQDKPSMGSTRDGKHGSTVEIPAGVAEGAG
jgi:hypothetical protein